MRDAYVHGYEARENERLEDQARALVDLLHSDTSYPSGSEVLEAGLVDAELFDEGVRALRRTTAANGVFCYTFFKGVGEKARARTGDGA